MKRFLNDACQINRLLHWMKYGFTFSPSLSLPLRFPTFENLRLFFVWVFSSLFSLNIILSSYLNRILHRPCICKHKEENSGKFKSNSVKFIDGLQNPKSVHQDFKRKTLTFDTAPPHFNSNCRFDAIRTYVCKDNRNRKYVSGQFKYETRKSHRHKCIAYIHVHALNNIKTHWIRR